MKKLYIIFIPTIIISLLLFGKYNISKKNNTETNNNINNNTISNIDKTTVSYNNWLHTDGKYLKNEKNEIIQLKGISSHGIEWFYDIITYENLKTLKETFNINTFRIAMYTDSNGQGYISNPTENKEKVTTIIEMATKLDMYVIVDWHILTDNNPQTYTQQSIDFFNEISLEYKNTPNVIYEICNEPNGSNVSWDYNVKPYAEQIIPIIRKNSPKSLIIVGTPDWCKDLKSVANNPLKYENILYSCHFYSGSHGKELQDQIDYCLNSNIPIFVSECGLTDASGNGTTYFNEFSEWISFLNSKNISWIYWSFSNKNESSALLTPEYKPTVNPENIDTSQNNTISINDYLSESGKFLKSVLK